MKNLLLLSLFIPLAALGQIIVPVTNADFELTNAGAPTSWTAGLGTLTNGDPFTGSNGALLTSSSTSPNSNLINNVASSLTGGLPAYLTVWVKPTALNDRSTLRLRNAADNADIIAGAAVVWNSESYVNSWHKIMMSTYTPASNTDAKVRIDNPIANDAIHYDNVEFVQNPLTVNGDMEIEFVGNNATFAYTNIYQKNQINPFTRDATVKRNGNFSLKCNVATPGATATFNQTPTYAHIREAAPKDYQASIWVALDNSSPSADFYAELWVDNAKVATGDKVTIPTPIAGGTNWIEIKTPAYTSVATGGGTVYLKLVCENGASNQAVFYVDDYNLVKADAGTLSLDKKALLQNQFTISKTGVSLKNVSGNVQIIDLLGRVLETETLNPNQTLDYNFKKATVYVVKVSTSSGSAVKKIIF